MTPLIKLNNHKISHCTLAIAMIDYNYKSNHLNEFPE
jgi:hypothetical protein